MKPILTTVLTAIAMSWGPVLCQSQDFSADVVYVAPGKDATSKQPATPYHDPSKLYVSKSKMRLETRGLSETILLVNTEDHSTVALFPQKKEFQPLGAAPSEYFHAEDAENACPDWQAVSERKIDCEKVGHESVDGRDAVKYRNKAATPASPLAAVWIDAKLNFVVRWESSQAAAELHNIKPAEAHNAAMFEVPDDYEQLRPKKKAAKGPAK